MEAVSTGSTSDTRPARRMSSHEYASLNSRSQINKADATGLDPVEEADMDITQAHEFIRQAHIM